MLEGWYCRTLANEKAGNQQEEPNVDVDGDSGSEDYRSVQKANPLHDRNDANESTQEKTQQQADYKTQYRYLKKKMKFLIYENEFFQDALRANQRRLLKVSRDRAFLLDRLLNYEKPAGETSDSDATESSDDDAAKEVKKRKSDTGTSASNSVTNSGRGRKRKMPSNEGPQQKSVIVEKAAVEFQSNSNVQEQQKDSQSQQQQGHMTPAEVERHLQSRQSVLELMPEQASATVPTEMFSNEPSLDGEPHEQFDGSPTHVAAEECVQMEYAN